VQYYLQNAVKHRSEFDHHTLSTACVNLFMSLNNVIYNIYNHTVHSGFINGLLVIRMCLGNGGAA
jgi:hypothetical protein